MANSKFHSKQIGKWNTDRNRSQTARKNRSATKIELRLPYQFVAESNESAQASSGRFIHRRDS